jgi:hypothetical protein
MPSALPPPPHAESKMAVGQVDLSTQAARPQDVWTMWTVHMRTDTVH